MKINSSYCNREIAHAQVSPNYRFGSHAFATTYFRFTCLPLQKDTHLQREQLSVDTTRRSNCKAT